jgi:hypothetical protein
MRHQSRHSINVAHIPRDDLVTARKGSGRDQQIGVGIRRPAALSRASISPKMRATGSVIGTTGIAASMASTNSSQLARRAAVSARQHP